MVVIPSPVRDALAGHAREELPNESCGLLVLRDRVADRYEPGRNAAASPYRFELEEGVVVCILADGGWKYLSAGFWQGEEIDESKLWW